MKVYVCAGILVIMTFNILLAETHPLIETSANGSEDKASKKNPGPRGYKKYFMLINVPLAF